MSRRPTIKDVAHRAGLSVATVNRVLAGDAAVRAETRRKVHEAARLIGYGRVNLIAQQLQSALPAVRLGFVLQKRSQPFYQAFARQIESEVAALADVRATVTVAFSPSQATGDVADTLLSVGRQVDVLAATAVNHETVTEAVRVLGADGVPVYAMLTDFALDLRAGYIGLDNLKVGRGAAKMLSVAAGRPGTYGLFVGGHRFHGQELRETGFRNMLRDLPGQNVLLEPMVNLETRQLTREATLAMIKRHPDLAGIYVAGGGMAGAIEALRSERRPSEVPLVVNELTPESRAGLVDGYVTMVIATPLPQLVRRLVAHMVAAQLGAETTPLGQTFLLPEVFLPELV